MCAATIERDISLHHYGPMDMSIGQESEIYLSAISRVHVCILYMLPYISVCVCVFVLLCVSVYGSNSAPHRYYQIRVFGLRFYVNAL